MYLLRLDDACAHMDLMRWRRMEELLDRYEVRPIVGLIPQVEDPALTEKYSRNDDFWDVANGWITKGWTPAMHGYRHIYITREGGVNPVNRRSEFAGLPLEKQRNFIRNGYAALLEHGVHPEIFFAPSHTFDQNTLKALEMETPIRVISDTIASDVYYSEPFYFIPQQSGRVRRIPLKTVTFCYHPNTMEERDFDELDAFLKEYRPRFGTYSTLQCQKRKAGLFDRTLSVLYFSRHR